MRVYTVDQIKEADRTTIERFGLPSHSLMEIAGHRIFETIIKRNPIAKSVFILLGRGNNGGDGLVVARLFLLRNCKVSILLTDELKNCSEDFRKNYEILINVSGVFQRLNILSLNDVERDQLKEIAEKADIIIDALLGTGIRSELKKPYNNLIPLINSFNLSHKVVSIDIPSGLNGDSGSPSPDAIRASLTITIGGGKAGLYSYPAPNFTGDLEIVDIGLPLEITGSPFIEISEPSLYRGKLKRDDLNFHKGNGGHIGILAGSKDRSGAAYLSVLGALKAGSGLVSLISEKFVIEGITKMYPEVMTREINYSDCDEDVFDRVFDKIDTLVIGPGLSEDKTAFEWIGRVIRYWKRYMVLDAEALKLIKGIQFEENKVVITPHPLELSRIIGISKDDIQKDRPKSAIRCAEELNAIVILKGARSIIANPNGDFTINMTGNQFMASGGMGDLLSGIVGGIMYQTGSPYEAARIGAYLHGLAADIAINRRRSPLIATDIAGFISEAMLITGIYE